MPEFSSSKIILHRFYIDNNEDKLGIGYYMIIGLHLMAQIGLLADFKRKFLQWDGVIVPKKETSGMLGQIYLVTAET